MPTLNAIRIITLRAAIRHVCHSAAVRVTGNGSLLGRWYRRRLLSRGAHAGDEGRVVAHEEAGRVLVLVTHDVERTLAIAGIRSTHRPSRRGGPSRGESKPLIVQS